MDNPNIEKARCSKVSPQAFILLKYLKQETVSISKHQPYLFKTEFPLYSLTKTRQRSTIKRSLKFLRRMCR